jgi:transcription antitermination factor NusG
MNMHAHADFLHAEPTNQERWHIAFAQPQCEAKALAHLPPCITPYLPKFFEKRKGRCGRMITVEKPMFPGYLFVRFGLHTPGWQRIFASPGLRPINTLMVINGHYASPSETEMAIVGRKENDLRMQDNLPQKLLPFHIGDTVRIEEGSFIGFSAEIETILHLDEGARIGLLMEMFGRVTRVHLPAEHLSPI